MHDDEQLDKMMLDHKMAVHRAKRLVEFMRVACRNEAQVLRDLGFRGGNNAGLSVQNDHAHDCD